MDVREKLVELVIKAQYRCGNTLCHGCEQLADSLIEVGVTIPTQGRWVEHNFLGHKQWVCSECQTLGSPQWKRCPVCEARMRNCRKENDYD